VFSTTPVYDFIQYALNHLHFHTAADRLAYPGQRSGEISIASTTNGQLPSPSDELAPSVRRATIARIPQHARPCYLLVALGFLVIGGSLAVSLYYSIAKDRMGDGFTAAGWMTAVGTLILAAPMAKHYPHCKCWGTGYTMLRQDHNTQM
jgi:hypothetical protein